MIMPHPRDWTHCTVITSCGIHTRASINRITAPRDCRCSRYCSIIGPHCARMVLETLAYPYPGRSTSDSRESFGSEVRTVKKLTARVFPGVLLTLASFFR